MCSIVVFNFWYLITLFRAQWFQDAPDGMYQYFIKVCFLEGFVFVLFTFLFPKYLKHLCKLYFDIFSHLNGLHYKTNWVPHKCKLQCFLTLLRKEIVIVFYGLY